MNLMRWEPFKDTEAFFRDFGAPLSGRWPRLAAENGGPAMEWAPAADVSETASEYLVRAELPGVKREDIRLSVEDAVLTIKGERKHEKEETDAKSHRIERFYGSFCRSFALPDNADAKNIRAEGKDGVLSVHVPKLKTEKGKSVEIKVD